MKRLLFAGLLLAAFVMGRGADGLAYAPDQNLSTRVRQTVAPVFPRSLLAQGVTSGWARVVIDLDERGNLTDWLVVAYTRPEFGEAAMAAIRQWEFYPMVINGRPTGSQVSIGFEYEARGVVVDIHPGTDLSRMVFGGNLERVYRPHSTKEIDRIPVPLVWVEPRYPAELGERGVRGSATVEFYIDETGAVRMPAIVQADFPELGALLVEAIRQWKFEPPTRRGQPVLVHARQTVTFGTKEDDE